MNSNDPASLQNLNDIVLPDTVGWWPLAPGWYILAGLLATAVLLFSLQRFKNWRNNQYRRAAINELRELFNHDTGQRELGLQRLPELIKRVALSAYPREEVAMLSGESWCDFLDVTAGKTIFPAELREAFFQAAYHPGSLKSMGDETAGALIRACEYWIRHHLPGGSRLHPGKA